MEVESTNNRGRESVVFSFWEHVDKPDRLHEKGGLFAARILPKSSNQGIQYTYLEI